MNELSSNIRDNLHFLIIEVENQLDAFKRFYKRGTDDRSQRLHDRQGYCENLMLSIQNACIQGIADTQEQKYSRLRAIQSIAADLDRISRLVRDAVKQMHHIKFHGIISGRIYLTILENICQGIGLIETALYGNDSRLALKLGEFESKVKHEYKKLLREYTKALKQREHTEDLILALMVAHSCERMGDLLLDIGNALLSNILGQPMDGERYHSLMASVQPLSQPAKLKDLVVEPIAETRSGSGISGISHKSKQNRKVQSYAAIYKDGLQRKLKEERDRVEDWHEIYPGLAPRILSYKKSGNSATLLIEHKVGMTFEQILVKESDDMLERCTQKLGKTLNTVWKGTKSKKSVPANYMQQILRRINDIYAVHPEFESSVSRLCGVRVDSFEHLIEQAEKIEQDLSPPYSVYIHGDFNVDNIIYDPHKNKISYIDLHRSCYMDYVQDISVFMVSNYRLQILALPIRRRIVAVIGRFYKIAKRYARRNGDVTFEIRLALGLARSLVTSTRFILDKSLARDMYLRSRYLLEQIRDLQHDEYKNYKVPVRELFIG